QPTRPVPLRLPGDAGRGLLRRPGPGQRPAPADAAVRHDEWAAAHPRTRGAVAALLGGEIRLQEPQAPWPDPLPGRTTSRLLGRTGLRLVRRPLRPWAVRFSRSAASKRMLPHARLDEGRHNRRKRKWHDSWVVFFWS